MTRETKVGLLVGMGVILLIGIIVSDHLAVMHNERREVSDFADRAQNSIHESSPDARSRTADEQRPADNPATGQREMERWTPDLEFGPAPGFEPAPADDRIAGRHHMPPAYALENIDRDDRRSSPVPPQLQDAEPRQGRMHDGQGRHNEHDNDEYQRLADSSGESAFDTLEREQARQQAEPEPIVHRVQRGESLYDIAAHYYGDGNYWRTIAEQNPDRIHNGEHVREGVELILPNRAGMARINDQALQGVAERANHAMRSPSGDGSRTITVERGDTLGDLAAEHLGSSQRWRELLEANRDQLDSDRDLRAGMTLKLPAGGARAASRAGSRQRTTASSQARTYVIRRGDTLTRIAERVLGDGSRWRELFEANRGKLTSPDSLPVGEEIQIPS